METLRPSLCCLKHLLVAGHCCKHPLAGGDLGLSLEKQTVWSHSDEFLAGLLLNTMVWRKKSTEKSQLDPTFDSTVLYLRAHKRGCLL